MKVASIMSLVLILACAASWASPVASEGKAEDEKLPQPLPWITIPFPGMDPIISKCWESFTKIPGCVAEIAFSFISGNIGLGKECCDVIEAVEDNCFSNMFNIFPISPIKPPMLKIFCSKYSPGPAAALN